MISSQWCSNTMEKFGSVHGGIDVECLFKLVGCVYVLGSRRINVFFFLTYRSPLFLSEHRHRVVTSVHYKCAQPLREIKIATY